MKSMIPWRWGRQPQAPDKEIATWSSPLWDDPLAGLFPSLDTFAGCGNLSVDVSEDKREVTVRAEIAGMDEKDVQLTWHDGVLRIHGEKKSEKEDKKKNHYYRECSYGRFSRDIVLGDSVDYTAAKARYRNGVLTVTLPKTEVARKAIEIKVA